MDLSDTMQALETAAEQAKAPEVAVEMDVLADWYGILLKAREAMALAGAKEKEAKEILGAHLNERGAVIGTINGIPRLRIKQGSKRVPPSVSWLEKNAPEVLEAGGKTIYFPVFETASFLDKEGQK